MILSRFAPQTACMKVAAGGHNKKDTDDPQSKMRPPVVVLLDKRVGTPRWSAELRDLGGVSKGRVTLNCLGRKRLETT